MTGALGSGLRRLLASDGPFRRRYEQLLVELPAAESDALMMLTKESRGAWALLLDGLGRRVLVCGDALSGTSVALATIGHRVVVLDRDEARLGFARERAEALVPGTTSCVAAGDGPALPFADDAFDVVVIEGGLPSERTGWSFGIDELRRVARDEVFAIADNRLGYKRSTGRRGAFERGPLHLASEVLRPSRGERSLPATRKAVRGKWHSADAFSLYPHAREFAHVVALDRDLPRLTIGPRERANRVKIVGHSLGLFRWLTPSFGIHARRSERRSPRIDAILDELAERIGERRPVLDILIGTRSNDAIANTCLPGRPEDDPEGRWTIHVPLQPSKTRMVGVHHRWLTSLWNDGPRVPVPEPLFHGEVAGVNVAVERRLGGINGTDLTGDAERTARMFDDAAGHMASLLEDSPTTFDEALAETMLVRRFRRVEDLVPGERTKREVRRMADTLREFLLGRPIRLAAYHADLRSKHIQVHPDGRVLGYLDWGASEERFLPLADLMQLIVHQRKQETGESFGSAWRACLRPGDRRDYENAAVERYAEAARLDASEVEALFDAYPILVAGMAERNWDYSRPDWVAQQFEIGRTP